MVNQTTGKWIYDPDEIEDKKCSCDYIADIITKEYKYQPQNISIEQLCEIILVYMEDELPYEELYKTNGIIDAAIVRQWLYDNQPISEFDYRP